MIVFIFFFTGSCGFFGFFDLFNFETFKPSTGFSAVGRSNEMKIFSLDDFSSQFSNQKSPRKDKIKDCNCLSVEFLHHFSCLERISCFKLWHMMRLDDWPAVDWSHTRWLQDSGHGPGVLATRHCAEEVPRISAVKRSISSTTGCTITEKAPTRAFSWLKAATTAFTFKTLLSHYAKRALTPRSLNVKLGPRRKGHKRKENGGLVSIVTYSRPSLMIIVLVSQFHICLLWGQC